MRTKLFGGGVGGYENKVDEGKLHNQLTKLYNYTCAPRNMVLSVYTILPSCVSLCSWKADGLSE